MFWGGAHRAPSPANGRYVSGFALGSGFALDSQALRALVCPPGKHPTGKKLCPQWDSLDPPLSDPLPVLFSTSLLVLASRLRFEFRPSSMHTIFVFLKSFKTKFWKIKKKMKSWKFKKKSRAKSGPIKVIHGQLWSVSQISRFYPCNSRPDQFKTCYLFPHSIQQVSCKYEKST